MILALIVILYFVVGTVIARHATRKGYNADVATMALFVWPLVPAAAAWKLVRIAVHWLATGSKLPARKVKDPS